MKTMKRRQRIQPRWHHWFLVVVILVGLGAVGLAGAWAQQGPGGFRARGGLEGFLTPDDREAMGRIVLQRAKERLGLSDQQAEQIRAIVQARRDEVRADIRTMHQALADLRQLLQQQNSDPAALRAPAERVKVIQGKLLDRRLETAIAIRSQLTAEQWAKWVELRKGRGQRWMGQGRRFPS